MTSGVETATVRYERKYSDGNYGSEGVSLELTFGIEDEVGGDELLAETHRLRAVVLEFLSGSSSWTVANAAKRELKPPEPVAAGAEPDLEELPY